MPTRAPKPTGAIAGHLVKSSASGPMPTSRYCDHMPRSTSTSFTRAASADPGRTPARSGPMIAWISRRTPSAREGSPFARSSMTRSSRLAMNVTPLAFTAWRSHGARSHGRDRSRCPSVLLPMMASRLPRDGAPLIVARMSPGFAVLSSRLTVGYDRVRSTASSPRTAMTEGPPSAGIHARPISKDLAGSRGRHSRADSAGLGVIVSGLLRSFRRAPQIFDGLGGVLGAEDGGAGDEDGRAGLGEETGLIAVEAGDHRDLDRPL